MKKTVSKQLGLGVLPPSMPAPPLDYQLGLNQNNRNNDFIGFDGAFAVPSDATRTGNGTFDNYLNGQKDAIISLAQRLKSDRNSGAFWDSRILDADINEDAIRELSKKAEDKSADELNIAKKLRQEAIDIEDDWNTTAAKARTRVDAQINTKARDSKLKQQAYDKINTIRESLVRHAAFKVLRDAYTSELENRLSKQKKVNDALATEDIKKLQEALGLATTEAQKTALNAKIQFVQDSAARKSKVDELVDKLGGATNEEQRKAIQAQIDQIKNDEAAARGELPEPEKPNLLLYGGIAVAAILVVVLIRRK
jgi:hypothetical protein